MDSDTYQSHCLNEDILASLLEPELQASPFSGVSPPYTNVGLYSLDSTCFSQALASPSSLSKSSIYGDEDEGFEDCPDETLQGATDPSLAESSNLSDTALNNITAELFPFEDDLLKTLQPLELVDQGVAMEPDLTTCLDYNVGIASPATTGIPSPSYSDHSPYNYSYTAGQNDVPVTGYNSPVPSTSSYNDTEMTNDYLYPALSSNNTINKEQSVLYSTSNGGLQLSDIDTFSFLAGSNVNATNSDIHQLLNYSDIPLNFGLTNNKTDTYTYQAPPTSQCPVPVDHTSSRGSQTERRSPTPSGLGMSPANSVVTEYTCTDSEAGLDAPSPHSPTLYCGHTRQDLIQMPYYEFKKILESPEVSDRDKQAMKAVRKKGKNKDAARDCRKRKMEVIRSLEKDIKELKGQKTMLALKALKLQKEIESSKKRTFTSKLSTAVR